MSMKDRYTFTNLDDSNLIGDIQSIIIWEQSNISLLLSIWSDQSVDLLSLDVIKTSHCILNLFLGSTGINNEDEGVVVFNLLHGRLCGQWEFDDGK